ncbi:MAG: nicotinamide mononucleotide transporter [Clostridia bacterium]|nr:nicotinamide mononucleotide transporter [Clostridia bacterium]
MKKLKNPFARLTVFEWVLWAVSFAVVLASMLLTPSVNIFALLASLVGVTALIFVAKGMVFGQVLTVAFAALYGVASFGEALYGEMITYLGMSAPAAIAAIVAWIENPYGSGDEVKVRRLTARDIIAVLALTAAVTAAFYFILRALGTSQLIVSTVSVATSFLPSALVFLRSPYYALGYTANDIVLIVMWSIAAANDISLLPMVFCFVMFLINDLYGFISWRRMEKRQG